MKKSNNILKCCWAYKYELLGLVFLVLATILTLATLNSVGIAAMFLVGLVLCAHKKLCCKPQSCSVCHPDEAEAEEEGKQDKSPRKVMRKRNVASGTKK